MEINKIHLPTFTDNDLDIDYIDKLIEQLKRKRKVLAELEKFKGVSLDE